MLANIKSNDFSTGIRHTPIKRLKHRQILRADSRPGGIGFQMIHLGWGSFAALVNIESLGRCSFQATREGASINVVGTCSYAVNRRRICELLTADR